MAVSHFTILYVLDMSSGAEHVLKKREESRGLVLGIPNIADSLYYKDLGKKENRKKEKKEKKRKNLLEMEDFL